MVDVFAPIEDMMIHLSVLALSSRFDGLSLRCRGTRQHHSFSTRSVESF